MMDGKNTFDVLSSIESHIEALKPLLPKQVLVCIGEYPIKTVLKEPIAKRDGTLPILIERSSEDIYSWLPKNFEPYFILGFEEEKMDTHFWYNVHSTIMRDNSIIRQLKKKPVERLHSAIIFSSIWDGIGSATLPTLISKFKNRTINSLSIAVLPSKIQPPDAHFNTYASIQMCSTIEGSTVLLLDRDQVESYEGVDRKGETIAGTQVVNYLLNLFLAKDSLVSEISELSRTFNIKLFSSIVITGASYKIYGSIENMLDAAWLKPLMPFDLSSSTLLYVLLRLPAGLKDKLPRAKIELDIANWFKEKTTFQSTYIAEPIYTNDLNDRIDAVLFIGGFDMTTIYADLQRKTTRLKNKAVDKGYMTKDWQVIIPDVEEEPIIEIEPLQATPDETPETSEEVTVANETTIKNEEKTSNPQESVDSKVADAASTMLETKEPGESKLSLEPETTEEPKKRRKFWSIFQRKKVQKVEEQKKETSA